MTAVMIEWKLRESFMAYLNGQKADIYVGSGAMREGGSFYFPAQGQVDRGFRGVGQITLRAHGGMMVIDLQNPQIEWEEGAVSLYVEAEGKGRFKIARCDKDARPWVPKLTYLGAQHFGGNYQIGTDFGELMLRGDHK